MWSVKKIQINNHNKSQVMLNVQENEKCHHLILLNFDSLESHSIGERRRDDAVRDFVWVWILNELTKFDVWGRNWIFYAFGIFTKIHDRSDAHAKVKMKFLLHENENLKFHSKLYVCICWILHIERRKLNSQELQPHAANEQMLEVKPRNCKYVVLVDEDEGETSEMTTMKAQLK